MSLGSDFAAGASVGFGIQDRFQARKQRVADELKKKESETLEAALREQQQKNLDRDYALREKALNSRIEDATAGRAAAGTAAEQQENVDFARMTPTQQQAYLAGNAPVGIGVVSPEHRDSKQRLFAARMEIVNQGQQREAEAAQQRRLNEIALALEKARSNGPSATVQMGPDGAIQKKWVRGVSPESLPGVQARMTNIQMPGAQPQQQGQQMGGGAPEISSQEEFDRLPQGAPFVWRSSNGVQKGVKK